MVAHCYKGRGCYIPPSAFPHPPSSICLPLSVFPHSHSPIHIPIRVPPSAFPHPRSPIRLPPFIHIPPSAFPHPRSPIRIPPSAFPRPASPVRIPPPVFPRPQILSQWLPGTGPYATSCSAARCKLVPWGQANAKITLPTPPHIPNSPIPLLKLSPPPIPPTSPPSQFIVVPFSRNDGCARRRPSCNPHAALKQPATGQPLFPLPAPFSPSDDRARRRPSCNELQCRKVQVVPWRQGERRTAMEKGERDSNESNGWVEGEAHEDAELAGALAALSLPVQFSGGVRAMQPAQDAKVSAEAQVILESALLEGEGLVEAELAALRRLKTSPLLTPTQQSGDGVGGGGGGSGGARGGKKKRRGRRRGDGQETAECITGAEVVMENDADAVVENGADAVVENGADALVENGAEAVEGGMGSTSRVAAEVEVKAVSANVAEGGAELIGGEQMKGLTAGEQAVDGPAEGVSLLVAEEGAWQAVEGQVVEGQAVEGQAVEGQAVEGQAVEGQAVEGQAVEGQAVEGQAVDGQAVEGQAVEGQAVEGQAVEGQVEEGQVEEGQVEERHAEGVSFMVAEEGAWQAVERQAGEGHAEGEQGEGEQTLEGRAEGVPFVVAEEGAWQAVERQAGEGQAEGEQGEGEQTLEGRAEGVPFVVAEEGAWQAVWEPLSHGVYFCNAAAAITHRGAGEQSIAEEAITEEAVVAGYEKYWQQRYGLFSRFNEGVLLDADAWPLVTPEAIAAHHAAMCAAATNYGGAACAGGDTATSAGGGGAGALAGDRGTTSADDGAATHAAATCAPAMRAGHTAALNSEEDALEQRGVRVTAGEEEEKEGGEGESCERAAGKSGAAGVGGAAGLGGAAEVGGAKGVAGGAGVVVDAFCGVGGNTIHMAKL
ncbi:unnamed protein product [Closterium sp. Naga37s-1]|nr:unnamed protein product [Closterium sp. Naga37s-1]